MIEVVNCYKVYPVKGTFDISRKTVLGNPYTHKENTKAHVIVEDRKRKTAIESYGIYLRDVIKNKKDIPYLTTKYPWLNKQYVDTIIDRLNEIYKTALERDVYLSCTCKPYTCHGDEIKKIIDEKIKIPL